MSKEETKEEIKLMTTTSTTTPSIANGFKEAPETLAVTSPAKTNTIIEKLEIDMSEINNNIKQHLSPENLLLRTSSPPSG